MEGELFFEVPTGFQEPILLNVIWESLVAWPDWPRLPTFYHKSTPSAPLQSDDLEQQREERLVFRAAASRPRKLPVHVQTVEAVSTHEVGGAGGERFPAVGARDDRDERSRPGAPSADRQKDFQTRVRLLQCHGSFVQTCDNQNSHVSHLISLYI